MGYGLHVTRKEFWADDGGPKISLEEWQLYVESDPEIERDPENPGHENYVIASHPERWPLWWDLRGEVSTKDPDAFVIAKLVQIAKILNATVMGDDDEVYGVDPSDPTVCEQR